MKNINLNEYKKMNYSHILFFSIESKKITIEELYKNDFFCTDLIQYLLFDINEQKIISESKTTNRKDLLPLLENKNVLKVTEEEILENIYLLINNENENIPNLIENFNTTDILTLKAITRNFNNEKNLNEIIFKDVSKVRKIYEAFLLFHFYYDYVIKKEEIETFQLNEKINMKGIYLNKKLINLIQLISDYDKKILLMNLKDKGIKSFSDFEEIKKYIYNKTGIIALSFSVDNIKNYKKTIIENEKLSKEIKEDIIDLFNSITKYSKTATKKTTEMLKALENDKRARNNFVYYGATATGRFSGKGIQFQNIKKIKDSQIGEKRNFLMSFNEVEAIDKEEFEIDLRGKFNNREIIIRLYNNIGVEKYSEKLTISKEQTSGFNPFTKSLNKGLIEMEDLKNESISLKGKIFTNEFIEIEFLDGNKEVLYQTNFQKDKKAIKEIYYIENQSKIMINKNVRIEEKIQDNIKYYSYITEAPTNKNVFIVLSDNETLKFIQIEKDKQIIKTKKNEFFKKIYNEFQDNIQDILGQLMRTTIESETGKTLIMYDFKEIEARVIALLSNETWKIEAFEQNQDIYMKMAAFVLSKPENEISDIERSIYGKIPEIALSYGGTSKTLENRGIPKEHAQIVFQNYFQKNNNLKIFWNNVNVALEKAWLNKEQKIQLLINENDKLIFHFHKDSLFIELLNKTFLCFDKLYYNEVEKKLKNKETNNVFPVEKLVQNISQRIARDVLTEKMKEIDNKYKIIAHIHDEVIIEVNDETLDLSNNDIKEIMNNNIYFSKKLKIQSDGITKKYYTKF